MKLKLATITFWIGVNIIGLPEFVEHQITVVTKKERVEGKRQKRNFF